MILIMMQTWVQGLMNLPKNRLRHSLSIQPRQAPHLQKDEDMQMGVQVPMMLKELKH
jgi:hypothetical protein